VQTVVAVVVVVVVVIGPNACRNAF